MHLTYPWSASRQSPDRGGRSGEAAKRAWTKPILFNEDDHKGFECPQNNLAAAVDAHVSWGGSTTVAPARRPKTAISPRR